MDAPETLFKATPAELGMADWCGAWSESPAWREAFSQVDTIGSYHNQAVRLVGWEPETGRYLLRRVARG